MDYECNDVAFRRLGVNHAKKGPKEKGHFQLLLKMTTSHVLG